MQLTQNKLVSSIATKCLWFTCDICL